MECACPVTCLAAGVCSYLTTVQPSGILWLLASAGQAFQHMAADAQRIQPTGPEVAGAQLVASDKIL